MWISDVRCRCCGAEYERAESMSFKRGTRAASYDCEVCGERLESDDPQMLLAYRLVIAPEPGPIMVQ